jgi:hypothetical protein
MPKMPYLKARQAFGLKLWRGFFLNVAKGQSLTGIYIPNAGAQFLFDNTVIGEIKDTELSKRFFDIWLAPANFSARFT